MIALVISGLLYPTKRPLFTKTVVSIGSAADNDIVLDGKPMAAHHARISLIDGVHYVEDLGSASGTFLNYRRITAPAIVRFEDRVRVGNHMIQISRTGGEAAEVLDDTEEQLLRAVEAGDEGSREAYADWLEQRGDQMRAEFVRRQDDLVLSERSTNDIILQLSRSLDPGWRARVSKAPIEQCALKWRFQCPKRWSALTPTIRAGVRYCDTCERNVYYCTSPQEARTTALRGDCVAIDAGLRRAENDLGYHKCGECDCVTDGTQCHRCGRTSPRVSSGDDDGMEVGELG